MNRMERCVPLLLLVLGGSSSAAASATEFYVPASEMDDEDPDDTAFEACLQSAIDVGGTCVLAEGTLIINHYPAPLRQQVPVGVLDRHGASLRGQGVSTIVKGVSEDGFDVLQLNGVKNFTIQDLKITTKVTKLDNDLALDHGVNGISMTNGTSNIRIKNVHVFDLPYVQKSNYIDGGKAFTVQTGQYATSFPMRNIYVESSSSSNVLVGFWMDSDTNTNAEPDNINVIENTFEGYLAGIGFSFVQPNEPMSFFGAAVLDNAVRGGKYGIALGRGRAYYLKGNHVVLRDDLYRSFDPGDYIGTRQPLYMSDVEFITVELNTFELTTGDCFLRANDVNPSDHLFRYNSYYGAPPGRALLVNSSPLFPHHFNASGTFH